MAANLHGLGPGFESVARQVVALPLWCSCVVRTLGSSSIFQGDDKAEVLVASVEHLYSLVLVLSGTCEKPPNMWNLVSLKGLYAVYTSVV